MDIDLTLSVLFVDDELVEVNEVEVDVALDNRLTFLCKFVLSSAGLIVVSLNRCDGIIVDRNKKNITKM